MIEIDGSQHSGSGTILRYAVSLATLTAQPLRIFRIREKREKPGLRPQHLKVVEACRELCRGEVQGACTGSREILYRPGKTLKGGEFRWDIGTAGSAVMLALALMPTALFALSPSRMVITGGLFQDFAPSFFHLREVLLPLLKSMGASVEVEMVRPGYVPKGQGELEMTVRPLENPLKPLVLEDRGKMSGLEGIALSSHLEENRVSQRLAEECQRLLAREGLGARMQVVTERAAVQKGAALLLWAATEGGGRLGADQAGRVGRRSESMARFVVKAFLEDWRSGAAVDRHLADQLVLFAALASGESRYRIPMVTDHVATNLWLVEALLGAKTNLDDRWLSIGGVGWRPSGR